RQQDFGLPRCDAGQFRGRRGAVRVPGVTEKAAQPKSLQACNRSYEINSVVMGVDAAAMETDVHLDENVDGPPGAAHRIRPSPCDLEVVDDEGDRSAFEEGDDTRRLIGVERIGKADILDARPDEYLRLAELGTADADRAAINLPTGDQRGFVRLGVRPE